MSQATDHFEPGSQVVITQQIPQANRTWSVRTEGVVVRYERKKTGSWFAHSKDDRLWLDRLVVRKADGEIVVFNLDQYTRVESVAAAPEPSTPDSHKTASA